MAFGDGAHEKKAEAGAANLCQRAIWNTVEALEDCFQFRTWNTHAAILHAQYQPSFCLPKLNRYIDVIPRILHSIIEDVRNGGSQFIRLAADLGTVTIQRRLVANRARLKMMAGAGTFDAFFDKLREIEVHSLRSACTRLASFQDLLNRAHQTVGIVEHEIVKFAALTVIEFTPFESLQVQPYRCNGSFQFMRNRVDETVVLLVSPDFADKKAGVENQAGDNSPEKDDAEQDFYVLLPVENDPSKTDSNGCGSKRYSDGEKKRDLAAPADTHAKILARRRLNTLCQSVWRNTSFTVHVRRPHTIVLRYRKGELRLKSRCIRIIAIAAIMVLPAMLLGQGPAVSPDKKASEVFKNVQVLKNVPSDQLIPAMQFITSSLGVQCSYCHVENAFDKDDKKPKQIARKMMQMELDIDANNFQGKQMVTCYSCHRGSPMPVSIPAIPESQPHLLAEAAEPNQSNQSGLPNPDQIIAQYVAAVGGEASISKLTTLDAKGSLEAAGRQFPLEILVHAPDDIATITHFPNGNGGSVFDGQSGWAIFPGHPPRLMTPGDVDASRMDADLHFALDLHKMFTELHVQKEIQVGSADTLMVSGQRQGLPPVELYFDKQSGLLARVIRYSQSPLGRNPTQIDYSDYRDVSGVKLPFRWTTSTPTGRSSVQLESAQTNVEIPQSAFEKPKPGSE